jgi:hypothetical protein
LVLVTRNTVSAYCNDVTATCSNAAGITAADNVRALGPATTVSLVVGAAGVAAGGIWLGLRPAAKSGTKVGVGPVAGGAAGRLEVPW